MRSAAARSMVPWTLAGPWARLRVRTVLAVAGIGLVLVMTVIWRNVTFIELSGEIRQWENRGKELDNRRKELEIEKAMLSTPQRIEELAIRRLGMTHPAPAQLRVIR